MHSVSHSYAIGRAWVRYIRLRRILCRGMQMSSIKIWRSANIITTTVVNSSVQIAGYRIIFQTMNNRFTSICGETSWLAFINCTWTLWTITWQYYNYCRFTASYPRRFDVADRSGKTNDNLMRNDSATSIPVFLNAYTYVANFNVKQRF